jgi:hypothetical protein
VLIAPRRRPDGLGGVHQDRRHLQRDESGTEEVVQHHGQLRPTATGSDPATLTATAKKPFAQASITLTGNGAAARHVYWSQFTNSIGRADIDAGRTPTTASSPARPAPSGWRSTPADQRPEPGAGAQRRPRAGARRHQPCLVRQHHRLHPIARAELAQAGPEPDGGWCVSARLPLSGRVLTAA